MPREDPVLAAPKDDVHASLRRDVLGGDFLPGQRLKFADLTARYGASIGVIREALVKLAASGIVRSEPNRGFEVVPLSARGFRELNEARAEVEVLVLTRAIRDGDVSWESRLVAAHHVMEQTPEIDPSTDQLSERWIVAHLAFHDALLDGCANRRLLSMAASLREETELYRRWLVPDQLPPAADEPLATHRQLLDATLARDAPLAAALLRSLIDQTGRMRLAESVAGDRSD